MESRSARLGLAVRGEPYWVVLEKGRSLGYRKGKKVGEWVGRYYDPLMKPTKRYQPLGSADDFADADGVLVLDYTQAQAAARKWFGEVYASETGKTVGVVTVGQAMKEYQEDRKRAGAKTAERMGWDINAHILPEFESVALERMTKARIDIWMGKVSTSGKRIKGVAQAPPETDREKTSRRATANRLLKTLKAALNLAALNHGIKDRPWEFAMALPSASQARIRFLSVSEEAALIDACGSEDFRRLIQGALACGAREGELLRLQVRDFDQERGHIWIEPGKTKKGRHVIVDGPDIDVFRGWCEGRQPEDLLFPRVYRHGMKTEGTVWNKMVILRGLAAACEKAGVERLVFHELRHTYASKLLNRGVPLVFVAAQIGDTVQMVEKHYGHLCDVARTEAIRRR
jgi:integrase